MGGRWVCHYVERASSWSWVSASRGVTGPVVQVTCYRSSCIRKMSKLRTMRYSNASGTFCN
eukprot:3897050-Amphidinium_carterae.2